MTTFKRHAPARGMRCRLLASAQVIAIVIMSGTVLHPGMVYAQSDVVVMRRVIAKPTRIADPGQIHPVDGADPNSYHWEVSGWHDGPETCSATATQTRLRGCVFQLQQVDDALCPQPPVPTERTVANYSGCGYSWTTVPAGEWASNCSASTTRPVTAHCERDDGTTVSDARCQGQAKPTVETGSNFEGCGYKWSVGNFGAWKEACSSSTTRERSVACTRSDGDVVNDAMCSGDGAKPEASETGENVAGCTFTWREGTWSQSDSTCSPTATQTRTNLCIRSDGETAAASLCTGQQPVTTRTVEDYSGCSYDWAVGQFGEWSSACSSTAQRSRTVECQRSDHVPADDKLCPTTKPDASETSEITAGCSYGWRVGEWESTPSCSKTAERTRKVDCRRSDDATVADAECLTLGAKPATSETYEDLSACGYSWKPSDWSAWDSTCSDAATRTRTASCERTDGTPAEGRCAGSPPPLSETKPNYTGCSARWVTGEWNPYSSTCSASASRSRTVTCMQRRPDGDLVADASTCDQKARPAASESTGVYSSCINTWIPGTWGWQGVAGTYSSNCDTQARQTQTPVCQATLANGSKVTVEDSNCDPTAKPATIRTESRTGSCTYQWIVGEWSPYNSTCSATATRTRDVTCRQSDPLSTTVQDSTCTNKGAGTLPARSESTSNVTDCIGLLRDGSFENGGAGWTLNGASISTTAHAGKNGLLVIKGKLASQAIQTIAGQKYAVSMWANSHVSQTIILQVDGVTVIPSSAKGPNYAWSQGGGIFTGTGAPMTISIVPTTTSSSNNAVADEIVVSPVN